MDNSVENSVGAEQVIDPQTMTDKLKPVQDRLPTVDAARSLFQQYRQAMTEIHRADAKVIALYRGVPPYDEDKLKGLGQAWRANINPREMKGSIGHRVDAAYDFHMDLDTRIKVGIRPEFREFQTANPLLDYGQIIAEEYTFTLNFDWPENYLLINQTTKDRVELGLGIASWRDHLDWRPYYSPKTHCFLDPKFPPLASKVPAVCFRDTLPIEDLLGYIENWKSAQQAGWNVAMLRDAVVYYWKSVASPSENQPPEARDSVVSWAAFEQWRASRPSEASVFELTRMPVIRYLVKSAKSDKVSHYIDVDANTVGLTPSNYIYKKLDQFDNMAQAVWLNPYTYAEGTIGSLDGLGHDLAPYCEISARMLCAALDGGVMSGGLILQAGQGFDADELSVMRIGPTTVIPPGLEAVQSSFGPPIAGLLELRSAIRGVWSNNVGMTRLNPEQVDIASRGTRSRDEIRQERNREFRLETNSANFEYMMWTMLHREMVRRMIRQRKMPDSIPGAKEAKAFYDRCRVRGVPEELFEQAEQALMVEVNRAIGDGSPESRQQIWGELMQLRGDMDEAGRRHTQREYTAALVGYRNVDHLFPLRNRNEIPTNEQSMATLENNDFMEGSYVPAGSDQIHVLHLDVHFKMLMGMAEAFNEDAENADIELLLKTFAAALPHVHEHVQFLAPDETRKALVNKYTQLLKELVMFYRKIEREAQETMDERQKLMQERQQGQLQQMENQMNAEAQVKLRKVELDAELEAMKQRSLADMRELKTVTQNEIGRWKAEAKAELDRSVAERKMALEEDMAQRKASLVERST